MIEEDHIVETIEEVAERFRKSARTIYRWRDRGMPVLVDGRFDLIAIETWVKRKKGTIDAVQGADVAGSGEASGEASSKSTDKDFWDAHNKKFQAKNRELDFKLRQKEVIEFSKVEDERVARVLAVKRSLIALERSLPPELFACRSEREMSVVIRQAIRPILTAFSRPYPAHLVAAASQTDPEGTDTNGTA